MVKVCKKAFPMGSFKGQKSDGFFMDAWRKANLDIMAEKIVDDMQFVSVISGKGTVRNGKSTLAQQDGFYFTEQVNKIHKRKNTFTMDNICFRADDLIEKAMKLPKYSVIILDEGDDLTSQFYTKLAIKLRRFFRKCGQLNLFVMLLIPDFFELPRPYAVTRTNYLLNVKFVGKFERGFYEFYSAKKKKMLYMKGKRWGDYDVVKPKFQGRFPKLYTVDEDEYRRVKNEDFKEDNDDENVPSPQLMKNVWIWFLKRIRDPKIQKEMKITQLQLTKAIEISKSSIKNYESLIRGGVKGQELIQNDYNSIP